MKIKAFYRRDYLDKGEWPNLLIEQDAADRWWGRNPFEELMVDGVSANLLMAPEGTVDGHNLLQDTMFTDGVMVDKNVPISPLFVKDLAGRAIYIGFGPERKGNAEWAAYQPALTADGAVQENEFNPFIPTVVFPRFCRDVEAMEGHELLEQVFLTKFRTLDMSLGFNAQLSGTSEESDLVAATYTGANLYPYKLRLDTFYLDGFKLPQTQMVYARGDNMDVNPTAAKRMGDELLASWQNRSPDMDYVTWFETLGEAGVEKLYQNGCTLIPTFEACNGYHVVGKNFELENYWPGRAVLGLHDVVEQRADKSPEGTILEVLEPGYVTATHVRVAKVIVSDGTGYISPNAENPEPLVPNLYLPHQRTLDSWYATWLPTHPEHFEVPAVWGWDLTMGRFIQLKGPIWDPLHYYYESVDHVLAAFEATPLNDERKGLVAVPHEMEDRFFPIVPMRGFDTFSYAEYYRRFDKNVLPRSCVKRVPTENYMAGIGYHPLPAEFEFELDTFWFPEMHPINRQQGVIPADITDRVVPVIYPRVTISAFVPTVDAPEDVTWLNDETRLFTPVEDPIENYPQLMRYLDDEIEIQDVIRICPVPFLSEPGATLKYPASGWWLDDNGRQLDGPLALQDIVPNVHDALWDMRQEGIELVQLRHMIYQTNLPLYIMAWWYGWGVEQLRDNMEQWIKDAEAPVQVDADGLPVFSDGLPPEVNEPAA